MPSKHTGHTSRTPFVLISALALLALPALACGGASAVPTAAPPTAVPVAQTVEIAVTVFAEPTPLPATSTPAPTNTPEPTATPTAVPTAAPPVILRGDGDDVVDIEKTEGPMIAAITHDGSGYFGVKNVDANGDQVDLLVNTAGAYKGVVPIDFQDGQHTTRFVVEADGPWTIMVSELSYARGVFVPDTMEGVGDDVFFLQGAPPDLAKIDATGADGYFGMFGYSDTVQLLANDVAPYSGVVPLDRGTILIVVRATGPWKVEFTAR